MEDTLAEFVLAQVEEVTRQQAILDSIHSKAEVEANRRFVCEAAMEVDEALASQRTAPRRRHFVRQPMAHEAGGFGTNFINISNNE